jgi:hypothetical protein
MESGGSLMVPSLDRIESSNVNDKKKQQHCPTKVVEHSFKEEVRGEAKLKLKTSHMSQQDFY